MTQPAGEQGDFLAEAQLALNDIGDGCVAERTLSKKLNNPNDISTSYLNIKSNENKQFCIELSQSGYRVVGTQFDDNSQPSTTYYESLQALLTNESNSYVNSFAKSLQQKLFAAQQQNNDNDDSQ